MTKTSSHALADLSDDTLAVVAASLTGGILSSRGRGGPDVPALVAEAQSLWANLFDSLRTLRSQEQGEPETNWD